MKRFLLTPYWYYSSPLLPIPLLSIFLFIDLMLGICVIEKTILKKFSYQFGKFSFRINYEYLVFLGIHVFFYDIVFMYDNYLLGGKFNFVEYFAADSPPDFKKKQFQNPVGTTLYCSLIQCGCQFVIISL